MPVKPGGDAYLSVSDTHLIGLHLSVFLLPPFNLHYWMRLPYKPLPLYPQIHGVRSLHYWSLPHAVGLQAELAACLERDGFKSVREAVGVDHRSLACWKQLPISALSFVCYFYSSPLFFVNYFNELCVLWNTQDLVCTPLSDDSIKVHTISHMSGCMSLLTNFAPPLRLCLD